MPNRVDSFSHAIARIPGDSAADGLRAVDRGAPDPALFRSQHADYVDALGETGARVEVLEPLEDFPDAAFVEDTALCLDGGAVLMRPGAPSRQGEVDAMAPVLSRFYRRLERIAAPATLEGGDILVTPGEILVGLSARSNAEGAAQLAAIVAPWGCRVRVLRTPPEVLHFKTDCSLLDPETILATPRLSAGGCFDGYRVVHTAVGEEAAANAIRFNGLLLMPAGFPRTRDRLVDLGYPVRELDNSEAHLLDGGMSCLSLRFTPPA
jgi:dimethylargininase